MTKLTTTEEIKIPAYPFLRWTGSKRWLIKNDFEKYLPKKFNNYHEPFLGGGAVFFFLKEKYSTNKKYFLSDLNGDLIDTYKIIKNKLPELIKKLKTFKNSEIEYYKIRSFKPRKDINKAAKFIFLNKTSFNGIYRVNKKGEFNVPYGKRSNVDLICENKLQNVSSCLRDGVYLNNYSFDLSLKNINKGDLVFLDPPYTVAHENNGFVEYNQTIFSWEDQIKLEKFIQKLNEIGAYYILTNACHSSIYKLYSNCGHIEKLSRHSMVGGRIKTRKNYNEVIITNFERK